MYNACRRCTLVEVVRLPGCGRGHVWCPVPCAGRSRPVQRKGPPRSTRIALTGTCIFCRHAPQSSQGSQGPQGSQGSQEVQQGRRRSSPRLVLGSLPNRAKTTQMTRVNSGRSLMNRLRGFAPLCMLASEFETSAMHTTFLSKKEKKRQTRGCHRQPENELQHRLRGVGVRGLSMSDGQRPTRLRWLPRLSKLSQPWGPI